MVDNDETRPPVQPVTFFDEIPRHRMPGQEGQVELERAVVERATRRFSTKALRAALFPVHLGEMDQPNGYARTEGSCGDLITFYLRIENGQIRQITFTTDGCDATVASGEMLASLVAGMPLEAAEQVTPNNLLVALDGLPPSHIHCAELAVTTLHDAIESYRGDGNS